MKLEFKPQFIVFLTIVFFFFAAPSFSQTTAVNRVGVKSITLLSVDYFEAKLEVDFYNAEDISGTFLSVEIPSVSSAYMPKMLSSGYSKTIVYVSRDKKKGESFETSHLRVAAYQGGDSPYYERNYELPIFWPGPEYRYKLTSGQRNIFVPLDEVKSIYINKYLNSADAIIKALLQHGYTISKINTFRPSWKHATNDIRISESLSPETIKGLLYVVASTVDSVPSIHLVKTNRPTSNRDVFIGSNTANLKGLILSENGFHSLKNKDLPMDEFLALLSLKQQGLEDKSRALYEEAYSLLDTGNKANRLIAKSLLDELIGLNPSFTKAYLEIARFHMKSNWPVGLRDAERAILIAKDIDPSMADVRVLLGYVYTHQGRYEEAEVEYKKADELGTSNLWLDTNWGQNFEKQGKDSKAIKHYLHVVNAPLTSDRNNRPKKWVFRNSGLLRMLIKDGQYQLADDLYGRSAEQFYYHRCELQKQAMLRVYHMQDAEGAISSYLRSKKAGCKKDSPALAMAYYSKWQQLKSGSDNKLIKSTFNQAESAATGDDELFYYLARHKTTAVIIPELMTRGHDINYVNYEGMTALLQSIKNKDHSAIERLLAFGADINQQTVSMYYRPIIYAIYLGDIEVVRLLIKHKADYQISLEGGMHLHEFALSLGFEGISKLLKKVYET
ncbi:MAG: ankyrin repeat domain-containing protein [Candidatus Reddybacter sp.]